MGCAVGSWADCEIVFDILNFDVRILFARVFRICFHNSSFVSKPEVDEVEVEMKFGVSTCFFIFLCTPAMKSNFKNA